MYFAIKSFFFKVQVDKYMRILTEVRDEKFIQGECKQSSLTKDDLDKMNLCLQKACLMRGF